MIKLNWIKLFEAEEKEENNFKKRVMWLLCFSYYKYLKFQSWLWVKNFDKTHMTFSYKDGKFQITTISHEDFVKISQTKINKLLREKDLEKFIQGALVEALDGCNSVIFDKKDDDNIFIQFWTGRKRLEFDFCANKNNRLKKYYYEVLGILADQGIAKEATKNGYSYVLIKNKGVLGIQSNMGKDISLATRCVETILIKVYKLKPSEIRATVY